MVNYIKNIHINKLFHLENVDIDLTDEQAPHLLLTGKNGSGKTVLLNAIADFLDKVKNDINLHFTRYKKWIENAEQRMKRAENQQDLFHAQSDWKNYQEQYNQLFGKIILDFGDSYDFIRKYQEGQFIIAFYQAARKTTIIEPKNPTKPTLGQKGSTRELLTSQLLNFLSDLKIQEALARNEDQITEADQIKVWFENFEDLLKEIYEDDELHLKFNYKDYTFRIETQGKSFKFTELSDGFIAILDVVADLILKMQDGQTLVSSYRKEGIVMIDEIETHLHLALQKNIMPLLTKLFPNIQFIVSTHSPFVLNSLPNAVAFDLEHQNPITDLTEYSYQALTEGYFGVDTDSNYAMMRLEELANLLNKNELSVSERATVSQLLSDFDSIPEALAPALCGKYGQLLIEYSERIKQIRG